MENMQVMEDLILSRSSVIVGSNGSTYITTPSIVHDSLAFSTALEQASTSHATFVTANIELSKYHWSERVEIDCDSSNDEIVAENLEVFESLQKHSSWGDFFRTFGYDTQIEHSSGEMVVGEKFAEGGQAELFLVDITWKDSKYNKYCEKEGVEWVLKVFKKGTLLKQLQSQWPEGYLEWWANDLERERLGYPQRIRWKCAIMFGTLMRDGRFAFLMVRERGDLRSLIMEKMLKCGDDVGPFSKDKIEEILYDIARGVDWLHKHGIVHRDIKASNVLVKDGCYLIADYECSIGVVGTGLWRAPEILQACLDRSVHQKPELFTKASDVYSYGMTCYEVLIGKFPFQDEGVTISDVIKGKQPHVPGFVDTKYKNLLSCCWQLDPMARPSFDEILSLLEAHSESQFIRRMKLERMKVYESGHALLGCSNATHTLELLECATNEGGSYACKLCLEMGNGEVYHCTSCGDFDLHPECARPPTKLLSFLHPHELDVKGPYNYRDHHICDGCLEDLKGSQWTYRCESGGCDFDLHARCGKLANTIFHTSHKEHKLSLISNPEVAILDGFGIMCDGCKIKLRPKELVYNCKECNFIIHPNCALENLVGS